MILLNLIQVKKIRNFSFALALMNTFFEILAGCISLASTVYCNQIYNLEILKVYNLKIGEFNFYLT